MLGSAVTIVCLLLIGADFGNSYTWPVTNMFMEAKESKAWHGCWAYLGIDSDPKTVAVALNASSTIYEFDSTPWWMADLILYYVVTRVDIVAPANEYFSNTLENFGIYVSFHYPIRYGIPRKSCANITNPEVKPSETLKFECPEGFRGRYVLIKKFKDKFTSELLSLAEVIVYYDSKKGSLASFELK